MLKSEARHFRIYLDFAEQYTKQYASQLKVPLAERIAFFLAEDQRLVQSPDPEFSFHSGLPAFALMAS